ncbi:MAG: hypothetical protein CL843_09155 [Crocinitomicaceae bacterium]|nr:hypothetical protein [Crocinitomicaceae bacterium]|tara:strand:+ start:6320 stop:6709 length:390 start_codon:yes stop_codon:yes gene_type:complete
MNLQLPLKKQWFEMTKSGVKTEDYRALNCYWAKRLVYNLSDVLLHTGRNDINNFVNDDYAYKFLANPKNHFGFKEFTTNVMTLGYPKNNDTSRIIKLQHEGIEIGFGKPEWGADPDKLYFIIKHGCIVI